MTKHLAARLLGRHEALFWQMARYGVTGGIASFLNIGIYLAGTYRLHANENLAWTAGFVVAVVVGYLVNSRWSFRGHGHRGSEWRTAGRYLMVALVSYALNMAWVGLMVGRLDLPRWSPTPLTLFVTPILVFALNRRWVFG